MAIDKDFEKKKIFPGNPGRVKYPKMPTVPQKKKK